MSILIKIIAALTGIILLFCVGYISLHPASFFGRPEGAMLTEEGMGGVAVNYTKDRTYTPPLSDMATTSVTTTIPFSPATTAPKSTSGVSSSSKTPTPKTASSTPSTVPISPSVSIENGLKVYKDIVYATRSGFDQKYTSLDVYTNATISSTAKKPVIFMIHGGGWRRGDKSNESVISPKAAYFISKGYIFVSINYRLTEDSRVKYPQNIEDVAAAVAWVNKNIGTYLGDGNRVYVMGHSAGGHLAALISTDHSFLQAQGVSPNIIKGAIILDSGLLDLTNAVGTNVEQLITMYTNNDPQVNSKASPINYLSSGKYIPPMLLLYATSNGEGRSDIMSKLVADKLTENGYIARAVGIPGKDHEHMNADVGVTGDPLTKAIDVALSKL
ncbi:MAG: alpha/beta hydrolase [Patescibacteria group bacterium]